MPELGEWKAEALCADDPEARDRSLELLRLVFGPFPFTAEYWQWKYVSNPAGASILIGARVPDGRMLGFRALWRMAFRRAHDAIAVAQPVDTAVHPSARRQGIFSAMTARALDLARRDGISLLFNNPNPEAAIGYRKIGWRDLGGLRWAARPVRKMRVLTRLAACGGRLGAARWLDPHHRWEGGLDPDVIPFLEHRLAEYPRMTTNERSAGWLRWRYAVAPHRQYGLAFAGGPGDRGALVVYGVVLRAGLREVQVVDLATGVKGVETARGLLEGIIEREEPDWVVHSASDRSPERAALRALGFLPLPRRATLMGISLREAPEDGCLSVVPGDLDTF